MIPYWVLSKCVALKEKIKKKKWDVQKEDKWKLQIGIVSLAHYYRRSGTKNKEKENYTYLSDGRLKPKLI